MQVASGLAGLTLVALLLHPSPFGPLGRILEVTITILSLVGLASLTRTPPESQVRPIALLAFVSFLLGITVSVFPVELISSELAPIDLASLQLAFFAILLVSLVALLTATRRLVLWLGVPRLYRGLLWVSRILRFAIVVLLIRRYAPITPQAVFILTIIFGAALCLCCLGLSFLFGAVRKELMRGGAPAIPEVFN